MSEMIERVATALTAQMLKDQDETSAFYGDDGKGTYMKHLARAAIEAMREPTEDMLVLTHPRHLARLNWQAMIDAALKDPTS